LVLRPRLLERLDEGMRHKCTLISAPAGFGKTTLLAAWTMRCKQVSGQIVSWLSLDEGDNDPQRFWSYFVAALQSVQPAIGSEILPLLRSSQPLPSETLLVLLVNELAGLSQEVALVLDDYHVIDTPALHHALSFLLDHLPAHMHLLISSRSEPPLPLARLRAGNELVELRAAELRFTREEAANFLQQTMNLALPEQAVTALEARTEGWIAALQLAALALKGQADVSGFLTAFTTGFPPHRHIADYLVEEVLERQPEPVRTFLLRTCILERLNSPLCQAVSGMTNAQEMLRLLEQRNVFLVPLDEQRIWYRYHQLFAEVLRNYVCETMPEQLPELHRTASDWYERQGYYAEAIEHALAAMEMERAAMLIEATNWQYDEYAALQRWLQALPAAIVQARPRLCILYALLVVLSRVSDAGQMDLAETYLRHAQRSLPLNEEYLKHSGNTKLQPMQGEIAASLSALVRIRGEIAVARAYAYQALALLPHENITFRYMAARTLVNIYMNHGDIQAADRALEEFKLLSRTAQDILVVLNVLTGMAVVQTLQGQLHQALATYQEIIQRAEQKLKHWQPAWSYAGMGGILLEWNALDEAEPYLLRALEVSRETDNIDVLMNTLQQLALFYWARDDMTHAFDCIDEIERAMLNLPQFSQKLFGDSYKALRAWLLLACGDLAAARRWAQSYRYANEIDATQLLSIRIAELTILARIDLAENRLSAALQRLEQLLPAAEKAQRMHTILWILILRALVLAAQGDMQQAVAALMRALALAEPGGYIRTFVNEGAPVAALLSKVLEALQAGDPSLTSRVSCEYVQSLLAAFGRQVPLSEQTENGARPLEKPQILSKRECEVVYLMSLGLSDREIAQQLVVTENTIKTHAKRIYSRLNAKNRAEAVIRARELHLF
jgi:LuxR family maltose regulon positive regulatory protein